jgi:hypothetical protein
MTSDADWDPSFYDNDIHDINKFHDPSDDFTPDENFDQYGEYQHCTIATHRILPKEAFFDTI